MNQKKLLLWISHQGGRAAKPGFNHFFSARFGKRDKNAPLTGAIETGKIYVCSANMNRLQCIFGINKIAYL